MDPECLRKLFGRRVRVLRKLRGLTQGVLAEESGLSVEYISRIERGLTSPSFDTIGALCKTLRVEPYQLFDFSELDIDQNRKK
jgi:transcriptional regulator with XRE-family HTH domain